MRSSITAATAVAVLVTGCAAPSHWVKDGATRQSFAQDKLECMQTAYSSVPGQMAFGPPALVILANAAHQQRQKEIAETCMESKGYEKMEGSTQ